MKIIFFGTSEFGAITLEKLIQADLSPVLVVTTPDMPAGRKQELTPPPVKVLAKTHGLEVFQPEKLDHDAVRFIKEKNPDLSVVASYGKILPKALLDIPQKGSLNVHPSLLPKYRGSSPVQAALLNGDKETGVSIIMLNEKMDHGPVVAVERFDIQNKKYTYLELHNALADVGGDLLIRTIPVWVEGKIKTQAQDESQATYTSHMKKEDGRIDWGKEAVYIERQVRALYPWPGTYTLWEGRILKILKGSVIELSNPKEPGLVIPRGDGFAVTTEGNGLLVEQLQLEGGKPMSAREFLLGHEDFLNTILE